MQEIIIAVFVNLEGGVFLKKITNRILSLLLSFAFALSLAPAGLAAEEDNAGNPMEEGAAYLDFDATEYEVKEGDKLTIRIIRYGADDAPVNVMVKVADFLSAYGTDYVVLDPDGKELEPVDGALPELSALAADDEEAAEIPDGDSNADGDDVPEQDQVYSLTPDAELYEISSAKKDASTGSSLLDGAYTYLDMPLISEKEETEDAINSALTELGEYFQSAQGAAGIVSFARGEREKILTVRTIDNDAPDGTRLLTLALLASDNESIPVAPDANTFVNLLDDEDRVPPAYTLRVGSAELSANNPETTVTVRRTSGTQYFSNVYLSTVLESAPAESYERISNKALAFVPGETEKDVTVRAVDFSEGGTFGIRLQSEDEEAVFISHYEQLRIVPSGAEAEVRAETPMLFAAPATADANAVTLQAANVVLGNSSWTNELFNSSDWETKKTGSDNNNRANLEGWAVYLAQYDNGKYCYAVSKNTYNLTGVYRIRFRSQVWGDGSKFTSTFSTITDKSTHWSVNVWSRNGQYGWEENDLWVGGDNNSRYLKYEIKANSGGSNNPKSYLDWFRLDYTRYNFAPQDSKETFTRKLYDFSTGAPTESVTYFDGQTNRAYNPGGVVIKHEWVTSSGSSSPIWGGIGRPPIQYEWHSESVSGFYANSGEQIIIQAANEAKNTGYGIRLKGVEFTNSGNNNKYFVAADEFERVKVTLNQDFVKTLINYGVVNSTNQVEETIRVYPVFEQEMVHVNFENTDRDDSKAASRGKFDASHLASHFDNIVNSSKLKKEVYEGWLESYAMDVPKNSVIRLRVVPNADRTPAGAIWWPWSTGTKTQTYYKKGQKAYTFEQPEGRTIEEDDPTMVEVVANQNMSIKPGTGAQTFYVGYSPLGRDALNSITDASGQPLGTRSEGLSGAVISGSITDPDSQRSGKDGSMWLDNAYTGNQYALTAIPPNGYYTYWGNLSGDTNNDGTIDARDNYNARMDAARSANPRYVFGSRLNMTIDTDNPRYYYEYMPLTTGFARTKTGSVVREKNTFYRLTQGKAYTGKEPVGNAYVNVAGFSGRTDANGKYSVQIQGLPNWGSISFVITADGSEYAAVVPIENNLGTTVLPAFEQFKAKSTSASYSKSKVNGTAVAVQDDTLSIQATVSTDNSIYPANARFFIHTKEGVVRVNCAETEGYSTTLTSSGNNYTATLSFNPKQDMQSGDTLWVQFADQNGKWYPSIDMGYTFTAILTMSEFIFPLLGSDSLENAIMGDNLVTDMLGNPLANLMMNPLTGLQNNTYPYSPPLAELYDSSEYSWSRTDYTFGWDYDSYANNDNFTLQKILEHSASKKSSVGNFATKGNFSWKIKPSVGFKLTLSSRNGVNYFEDLFFFLKVDTNVAASQTIMLPYGFSVVISAGLDGSIQGIYHMYNDHQDPLETEDAVKFDSKEFGIFKTYNNTVRREFYLFIDPTISIKLGLKWTVVYVGGGGTFAFDMDFQFTDRGTNAYGDVTITLSWNVDLFGFTVYENDINSWTLKLFNTSGTNGHINFDTSLQRTMLLSMMAADEGGSFALDRPASRDYLANRSAWNGEQSRVRLFSLNASQGTRESVLQSGTAVNPQMSLTKINDTDMLMVFVGDVPTRTDVNRRAVYYSIGSGTTWSNPVILDDDGTPDDYPSVCDLGDGRILVVWSSADKALEDGATVVEALRNTNLKAAFFNKSTRNFSAVEQLTKTTDADYAADVLPHAAYDTNTSRLILYYTKTEYNNITELDDLGTAASVMAYLFYENGKWQNNGDVYADSELRGTNEEKAAYREQWYGQRFLDLRTNSSSTLPRVADSDAICYNGLALFAWTVDWDNDLNTSDDRDIFLQIYNFSENSFTHIIRVTEESGTYASPQFARSDNNTYLFYGAKGVEEDGGQADHGEIRNLNISYLIKNSLYTRSATGNYYDLKYKQDDVTATLPDGGSTTIQGETVWADADKATDCDNIGDYRVFVNEAGQMYLFWSESVDTSRQIQVSLFNAPDENKDDNSGSDTDDGEAGEGGWSEPVTLTSGEGVFYSGIGAAVMDGTLYMVSGKGRYDNASDTSLVLNIHTPFSSVVLDDVRVDAEDNAYPVAGGQVLVTATLKNEGLLPDSGAKEVSFQVNGGETVTARYEESVSTENSVSGDGTDYRDGTISGGGSAEVSAYLTIPDEFENLTFTAAYGGETASVTLEKEALAVVENGEIDTFAPENREKYQAYTATVRNPGNDTVENLIFTAVAGDKTVGTAVIEVLEPGEEQEVEIVLDIPDSAYEIDENGYGVVQVNVEAVANGETVFQENGPAIKEYDGNAITLLTGATVEDNKAFTLAVGGSDDLQPAISGEHSDELHVEWQTTSDAYIASIDHSNGIYAGDPGTATLTGILVPSGKSYQFDANGNGTEIDWTAVIPEGMLKTVTATVTVSESAVEPTTSYTVTFESNGGSAVDPQTVEENALAAEPTAPTRSGYRFTGWYTDAALTEQFVFTTPITGDITLYAGWRSTGGGGGGNGGGSPTPTPTPTPTPSAQPDENANVTVEKQPDGSLTVTILDSADNSGPVTIPVEPVAAADTVDNAAKISIDIPESRNVTLVEIPLEKTGPTAVAFIQREDGTFEPVKDCYIDSSTNGMIVPLYADSVLCIVDNEKQFDDVSQTMWSADVIAFVTAREIFNGNGDGTFDPHGTMTRSMVAQILYNFDRKAEAGIDGSFTDVSEDAWYADAVNWCASEGLIQGYGSNLYGAVDEVTREQLATVLYRYASSKGYDTSFGESADTSAFTDAASIHDWALPAMRWAIGTGLINGMGDGTVNPSGNATREQVAAIMARFISNARG